MEVLRLNDDQKLNSDEVAQVFLITENYLFRRNICDIPANSLNRFFLSLNRDILHYDGTANNYVAKFIYTLITKKDNGRFPNDTEFCDALANKQVYGMRSRYKAYLFERYENYGTIETKDVYQHLDNGEYTIEHIMPQHLTPAWVKQLGDDYENIHNIWQHRLANLTLTGYNPNLSNNSFLEKRDAKVGGYRSSGLKMSQKIAQKDSWGLTELEERNQYMVEEAKVIWPYPETDFIPEKKEYEYCTLDDEDIDLAGREIIKFSYQHLGIEQPVLSWTEMFESVIKSLYQIDKSIISSLAYDNNREVDTEGFVSTSENNLHSAIKIDEHVFIEKNSSPTAKIVFLRKLFTMYHENPLDLVFYLKDRDNEQISGAELNQYRKKYWEYALPILQKKHYFRKFLDKAKPLYSKNTSNFGIGGFDIVFIANYKQAQVELYLGKYNTKDNKKAFDILYKDKNEIEKIIGYPVTWNRHLEMKCSTVICHLDNINLQDEQDWPRMVEFQSDCSDKLINIAFKYLYNVFDAKMTYTEDIIRKWTIDKPNICLDLKKCNHKYTRFTDSFMDSIIPKSNEANSGWDTENHYFYEIINEKGNGAYFQLAFSSKNASESQMKIFNEIENIYLKKHNKNWHWLVPYYTSNENYVKFEDEISENDIFISLDHAYQEMLDFEADLKQKLKI